MTNTADLKKFGVAFIVLMILCFIPSVKSCFFNSLNTVSVETSKDCKLIPVNNHIFRQDLILEGPLKRLALYFNVSNKNDLNAGNVNVKIWQNDKEISIPISVKDINTGLNTITLNGVHFEKGEASLEISANGISKSAGLYLLLSNDKVSGLPGGYVDGSSFNTPLVISYEVLRHDSYYYYDLILSCLLFIYILVNCYIYAYQNEIVSMKYFWFISSFFLLCLYILLRNPLAGFFNSPQSEAVYEFWYKAHTMSFFENLMSLMSGESLAWTERILMYVADRLTNGGKYVFALAQMFELCLISGVASIVCLPRFERYLANETRYLLAFLLGGSLLFPEAYYFWSVSYWVSIFILLGFTFDFKNLNRIQYVFILLITVIFCVSRIYHVIFVPVVFLSFTLIQKKLNLRQKIFYIIVCISCAFEFLYSLYGGGTAHITDNTLNIGRVLINTFYYQIQVINSYFMGPTINNPIAANIFSALLFLALSFYGLYKILKKDYQSAAVILSLLGVSFGTIMINVVVNMMSSTIALGHNYADIVNWSDVYFQKADLHFSYSYISLTLLLAYLIYLFSKFLRIKPVYQYAKFFEIALFILIIGNFNYVKAYDDFPIKIIPTDWSNEYKITRQDKFFLPVNAAAGTVGISLTQGTSSYVYGIFNDQDQYASADVERWQRGNPLYSTDVYYNCARIGMVSDIESRGIVALCARRASTNFARDYYVILLDRYGREIVRQKQITDNRRVWMDFQFSKPVYGCSSIIFEDVNRNRLYIRDGLQVGFI